MAVIMCGKEVREHIKNEVNEELLKLNNAGIFPRAGLVRVGDRSDSISYENAAIKLFNQLGVESQSFHFPENITEEEFLKESSIAILNATHLNNLNFRVRLSHLEIL